MSDFGHQFTAWLEAGMLSAGIPNRRQLYQVSGVARSTIDALEANRRWPDQRTLNTLAKAMRVPAPTVEPTLVLPGGASGAPTVRQALTLARRAIEQAERLLDAEAPLPTLTEAEREATRTRVEARLDAVADAVRPESGGGRRRAGGGKG